MLSLESEYIDSSHVYPSTEELRARSDRYQAEAVATRKANDTADLAEDLARRNAQSARENEAYLANRDRLWGMSPSAYRAYRGGLAATNRAEDDAVKAARTERDGALEEARSRRAVADMFADHGVTVTGDHELDTINLIRAQIRFATEQETAAATGRRSLRPHEEGRAAALTAQLRERLDYRQGKGRGEQPTEVFVRASVSTGGVAAARPSGRVRV